MKRYNPYGQYLSAEHRVEKLANLISYYTARMPRFNAIAQDQIRAKLNQWKREIAA